MLLKAGLSDTSILALIQCMRSVYKIIMEDTTERLMLLDQSIPKRGKYFAS